MPFNSINSINHYQQVLSLARIISQSFYTRVKKDSSSFISFLQRPVGSHTSGCIQWKRQKSSQTDGQAHTVETGLNHFRFLSDIITTTCMNYRLKEKRPQLNSSDSEAPPAVRQNVSLRSIVTRSWIRFGLHCTTQRKYNEDKSFLKARQFRFGTVSWPGLALLSGWLGPTDLGVEAV